MLVKVCDEISCYLIPELLVRLLRLCNECCLVEGRCAVLVNHATQHSPLV